MIDQPTFGNMFMAAANCIIVVLKNINERLDGRRCLPSSCRRTAWIASSTTIGFDADIGTRLLAMEHSMARVRGDHEEMQSLKSGSH